MSRFLQYRIVTRRLFSILAPLGLAFLLAKPTQAQFTPTALENAASLDTAVNLLNARTAQPSSHLLLDAPDVAVPGRVKVALGSELRGTSSLVLLRGKFKSTPNASAGGRAPPPTLTRKVIGEEPVEKPPTVWLASAPFKAGEPARLALSFEIEKTESLTLFALAQGRWWFVTKEVKVGQAPTPPAR